MIVGDDSDHRQTWKQNSMETEKHGDTYFISIWTPYLNIAIIGVN